MVILKLEKHIFHRYNSPIFDKLDIKNVLVSNKTSGEKIYKYFIDYLYDDYKIKQLHIILP